MNDSNNREIRTGDFVKITGAYFKTANGLFLTTDDGESVSLRKVKKTGELCLDRAGNFQSLPMRYYCDAKKNRAARIHDAENLRFEVVDGVPTFYAAEHFRQEAANYDERADFQRRMGFNDDAEKNAEKAAYYSEIADRLSATAEQPKKKAPETGIRFYWNGIKVNGGRLIPCYFWPDADSVIICAKNYESLPKEYFTVENDSDIMTDYIDSDSTTLTPEHPLYKYARFVALKGIATGHSYRKLTAEQAEEWGMMKDPGQPTAADLAAVEEMKTAAESARLAAEHAAQLAAREKALRKRSEGRHYIESVAEQHPITDGAPTVEITFSENPAFYFWTESRDRTRTEITIHEDGTRDEKTVIEQPRRRLILSVAAAEVILRRYDEQAHAEQRGYDKTYFVIRWTDAEKGEQTYEGRYDLGDNDGGLIAHIRAFGTSRLHSEAEKAEIARIADYLDCFTEGGRIVNVEIDTRVIDLLKYRQEQEKRKREREWEDIVDTVSMLTDEQIEAAVFSIDPKDKEKADVARFFLQELERRDRENALDVLRRWRAENG